MQLSTRPAGRLLHILFRRNDEEGAAVLLGANRVLARDSGPPREADKSIRYMIYCM